MLKIQAIAANVRSKPAKLQTDASNHFWENTLAACKNLILWKMCLKFQAEAALYIIYFLTTKTDVTISYWWFCLDLYIYFVVKTPLRFTASVLWLVAIFHKTPEVTQPKLTVTWGAKFIKNRSAIKLTLNCCGKR